MGSIALKALAFALPALIGAVSAFVGARSVRRLRESTGDDSALTNVLSGEVFRHHDSSNQKAA